MAKTIHSITLGTETFTRESASRKYTAALVSTVIEESLRFEAARAARCAVEATALEAKLAAVLASRGTTEAQERAEYKARNEAYEANRRVSNSLAYGTAEYAYAQAAQRRLFNHLFDKATGPYPVVQLADDAKRTRRAAEVRPLVLGSAVVVSWHHSVALASKAAGHAASQDDGSRRRAYSVRTDIATRERATRGARATAVAS